MSPFCPPGPKNKPVLCNKAWENSQWVDWGPGTSRRLRFIWTVTNDGKIYRETQVGLFFLLFNIYIGCSLCDGKSKWCWICPLCCPAQVVHPLPDRRVRHHRGSVHRSVCLGWRHDLRSLTSPLTFFPFFLDSGRPDRLAHLPLGSGHPEEDRAGQGLLTASPLPPLPPPLTGPQWRDNTDQEESETDGWAEKQKTLQSELNERQRGCGCLRLSFCWG